MSSSIARRFQLHTISPFFLKKNERDNPDHRIILIGDTFVGQQPGKLPRILSSLTGDGRDLRTQGQRVG